jgi:hypothetical protein
MSLYENLDVPSTRLTSTPPIGEDARLIATLPPNVTGAHLKALKKASAMTNAKFAALLQVSPEWLRAFEVGRPPILARARAETQAGVARAMIALGVRLTNEGWELLNG